MSAVRRLLSAARGRLASGREARGKGDSGKTAQELSLLQDWYKGYCDDSPSYALIAFSRDRPMQLHAFLSSFLLAAGASTPVTVLYYCSTPEYVAAYGRCFDCFAGNSLLRFIRQADARSFRANLLQILLEIGESRLAFAVDDIVFIRDFDFHDFDWCDLRGTLPSLRLGRNVRYSYATNQLLRLPHFTVDRGFLIWEWRGNDVDWAYPLSLDGNIYLRSEIIPMLTRLELQSPNMLEASMQTFVELFLSRRGICYELPRLINLPLNRVQKDFPNRSGNLAADFLLSKWQEGLTIDIYRLRNLASDSVHAEQNVEFVQRGHGCQR